MQTIIESIDRDIKDHNSKAEAFLSVVYVVLSVAVLFALLYILPSLAERILPEMEKELSTSQQIHRVSYNAFLLKYKKKPYEVTQKDYEKAIEAGTATDEMRDAFSLMLVPSDTLVKLLRFIRALKIEDKKMEYLGTIVIPIALGGVLAGFLLTYRFHAQAAKEFSLKKLDLLQSSHFNKPR